MGSKFRTFYAFEQILRSDRLCVFGVDTITVSTTCTRAHRRA